MTQISMTNRRSLAHAIRKFSRKVIPFLLLGVFASLVLSSALSQAEENSAKTEKPNVVIFFIDDLGRSDIVVDGSKFHETPNLDALAASGVRFTDFYSAHPVCSPTRAAMMTGKVPQRVGITDWIHQNSGIALASEEVTMGEAFQSHGYQTAYLGKWHLGQEDKDHPTKQGFEWTSGVNRAGGTSSYYYPFQRGGKKPLLSDVPHIEGSQEGDYLTDVLTTSAIDFLKTRDQERPFLMCLAHYAVHTPIQPPGNLAKKYEAKREKMFGDSETPTLPAPNDSTSRARQDNPDFAAMVENLDENIGRVLKTLDDLKLRENTIVIFTSDNGGLATLVRDRPGPTCNLPWRSGKGWHYEGGIRIPTYISWPGHLKPATSHVPGYTADFFPTLLELCGLPLMPEKHLDGKSLVKALRGESDPELTDRPLAWYYPHDHGSGHKPSAAIRRGDWKLIHFFESDQVELYNLAEDPSETTEISKMYPKQVETLLAELKDWVKETTK